MEPIFSYNADISKNAYLNWRIETFDTPHNFSVIANGYHDAAVILINAALVDNHDKKADSIILPILYCIDQSFEVIIKATLYYLEVLNGQQPSKYNHHDIKALRKTMEGQIKKLEGRTAGLQDCLEPVDGYINELYSKIMPDGSNKPAMDFARYPIDSDGKPHFYVAQLDNVVIDMENLRTWYEDAYERLDGLFVKYQVFLENN